MANQKLKTGRHNKQDKFVINITIWQFSLTCVKCGIRSTLCRKISNIAGSTKLFAVVILNGGLKLPKLSIHTLVMLQKHFKSLFEVPFVFHFLPYLCNSIVVFTTYWKFWCCWIHCLFGVNECQQLVCTHTFPFIPNWYYLTILKIYMSHWITLSPT